ncbi:hypothetical protein cce_0156 [Crocosphaera subtropica ATCC 51142]|uniref:Uncharacterized protein n=1 Tax=Crocosphaera subtropica (strain ATCC 51142 / BH68) TaxID=43989 RepID=B1WZE2_CROS5|nr:hypothetical protein cce_0156 [Crocosphaera subtropica ATCC 51142]
MIPVPNLYPKGFISWLGEELVRKTCFWWRFFQSFAPR